MAEANANLGDAGYPLRGRFRQLLTDALLTRADFNMYLDKGHSFHRRRSDRR
ncbi:hypothetical protein ACTM8Z_01285 [Atopobiaceae bacterium HCP3S3_D6]